jgi:hypothetical protein
MGANKEIHNGDGAYPPKYLDAWASRLSRVKELTFFNGYRFTMQPLPDTYPLATKKHILLFDRDNGMFGVATLKNLSKSPETEVWRLAAFVHPDLVTAAEFYASLHRHAQHTTSVPPQLLERVERTVRMLINEEKEGGEKIMERVKAAEDLLNSLYKPTSSP